MEPSFARLPKTRLFKSRMKQLAEDGQTIYRAATSTEAKGAYRQASEVVMKLRKK